MNSTDTIRAARAQGAHNPFAMAAPQPDAPPIGIDMNKPKTTFAPTKHFDPEMLEICDDEIPAHRKKANKYVSVFERMKIGQAMKVPSDHVSKVGNALRKWITDQKLDAHVRSIQMHPECPQKLGRVWMMGGPQSAATVAKRAA